MYCVFYRVIEARVEVGENEKWRGNTSRRRVFPQLFRVLPNFHECFYNSIETRSTYFLFLLENTATRKRSYLPIIYAAPSTRSFRASCCSSVADVQRLVFLRFSTCRLDLHHCTRTLLGCDLFLIMTTMVHLMVIRIHWYVSRYAKREVVLNNIP